MNIHLDDMEDFRKKAKESFYSGHVSLIRAYVELQVREHLNEVSEISTNTRVANFFNSLSALQEFASLLEQIDETTEE